MLTFLTTSVGLALFIGAMWLVRCVVVVASMKKRTILTTNSYAGPVPNAPKLSVLVAAKDEEANIETCVRSLMNQDYPDYELIVVDDRSADRTPEILQELKKEFPNQLQVLRIEKLKDDWFGKSNALREGIAVSSGDWLCFIDADCQQTSPRSLSIAMHESLNEPTDFLSITPIFDMNTFWDRILQPACSWILLIWFHPGRVNNPETTTAYANGAFMFMRRSCYIAIGGHEAVKHEVNEDILMARHTKEAGLRLRLFENDGLYRICMYPDFKSAWNGWSRIFYGSLQSTVKLGATAFSISFFSLLPWVCLIAAVIYRVTESTGDAAIWNQSIAMWSAVLLMCQLTCWKLYSAFPMSRAWSLFYPLGAVVTLSMIINALFKQWGLAKTTFRGTTYHLKERVDVDVDVDIAA